jgi:hypothetical protein
MTSCRHAIHACDVKTLCLLDDRLEVAFRVLQPLSQAQPRRAPSHRASDQACGYDERACGQDSR